MIKTITLCKYSVFKALNIVLLNIEISQRTKYLNIGVH